MADPVLIQAFVDTAAMFAVKGPDGAPALDPALRQLVPIDNAAMDLELIRLRLAAAYLAIVARIGDDQRLCEHVLEQLLTRVEQAVPMVGRGRVREYGAAMTFGSSNEAFFDLEPEISSRCTTNGIGNCGLVFAHNCNAPFEPGVIAAATVLFAMSFGAMSDAYKEMVSGAA